MSDATLDEVISAGISSALVNLHTCTVAKVTVVNESTINCQPVIKIIKDNQEIRLPEFIEVPIVTLQGGGSSISFPINIGDYCLLFIAERCIDNWYMGSDNLPPREKRLHDYSDSFALVGVNPQKKAISIPKITTIQGDLIINGNVKVNGDITHIGDLTQTGNHTITGDIIQQGNQTIEGNVSISDNFTLGGNMVATGTVTAKAFIQTP